MTKKVNPPSFYRVPILPTLAAVGLGLLVLPACSKSGQVAGGMQELIEPSDLEEVVVPVVEDPLMYRTAGVPWTPPAEPEEEAIPSDEMDGDVSMVPLDEKPPEVLQPVPSGGEETDMDAEKPTVLRPEEPPIYRTAGVPLPPTEPEEEVAVPAEEEYSTRTDGTPPIKPRVKKPPKVRPEAPQIDRLGGVPLSSPE